MIPYLLVTQRKNRAKEIANGIFVCPACKMETGYRRMRLSAWHHIFGIPVYKRYQVADYLACAACDRHFALDALDTDPLHRGPDVAEEIAAACRSVVLSAGALMPLTPARDILLRDAYAAFANGSDFDAARAEAAMNPVLADDAVRTIAPYLSEAEKIRLVERVFALLQEDGALSGKPLLYMKKLLNILRPQTPEAWRSVRVANVGGTRTPPG